MTLSGLGAFALASALDLAQGFWAVITALIVSQSSVAGSPKAAWERFLGSVFGAVYGEAVALAIPHAGGWSRAIALVAASGQMRFPRIDVVFRLTPGAIDVLVDGAAGRVAESRLRRGWLTRGRLGDWGCMVSHPGGPPRRSEPTKIARAEATMH